MDKGLTPGREETIIKKENFKRRDLVKWRPSVKNPAV